MKQDRTCRKYKTIREKDMSPEAKRINQNILYTNNMMQTEP